MFYGSYTALITPFTNGKIDEADYQKIIEAQIAGGTHGLVPSGTTGESPTLSHDEHGDVIKQCVEVSAGRAKVMAGTGSNSTAEAISMTQAAQDFGADAALIVMPYYNKPNARGLVAHFKALHDNTDIPLIIYNIPGRSVIDMSDEVIAELAELPRIAGVKDATGDLSRPTNLVKLLGDKAKDFSQLSGEDETAIEFNQLGGSGCISVTANIAPKLCSMQHEYSISGEWDKAFEIQNKLMPLHKAMFMETSPQPVKYAASLLGLCNGEMRLPMVEVTDETKNAIKAAMEDLELC